VLEQNAGFLLFYFLQIFVFCFKFKNNSSLIFLFFQWLLRRTRFTSNFTWYNNHGASQFIHFASLIVDKIGSAEKTSLLQRKNIVVVVMADGIEVEIEMSETLHRAAEIMCTTRREHDAEWVGVFATVLQHANVTLCSSSSGEPFEQSCVDCRGMMERAAPLATQSSNRSNILLSEQFCVNLGILGAAASTGFWQVPIPPMGVLKHLGERLARGIVAEYDDGANSRLERDSNTYRRVQVGIIRLRDDDGDGDIRVVLRRDKNEASKCVNLLFTRNRKKVGYILLEVTDLGLALRGMRINEEIRGRGLAKAFLSVWLLLCRKVGAQPQTCRIDKPIICLVLQNTFGFTQKARGGGVRVEVSPHPDTAGVVVLWSDNYNLLVSNFSHKTCRKQGFEFAPKGAPRPLNGRDVAVKTILEAPDEHDALYATASGILKDFSGGGSDEDDFLPLTFFAARLMCFREICFFFD